MTQKESMLDVVWLVIRVCGGRPALSASLEITEQAIQGWIKRGRVPREKVFELERLTGMSRERLRPDIYGAPRPRPRTRTSPANRTAA